MIPARQRQAEPVVAVLDGGAEGDHEARDAAEFLAEIGLPVHLGQISLDLKRDAEGLQTAMAVAASFPFIRNEPFEVTPESLFEALSRAHELGLEVTESVGDAAYRELRAE